MQQKKLNSICSRKQKATTEETAFEGPDEVKVALTDVPGKERNAEDIIIIGGDDIVGGEVIGEYNVGDDVDEEEEGDIDVYEEEGDVYDVSVVPDVALDRDAKTLEVSSREERKLTSNRWRKFYFKFATIFPLLFIW